MNEIAELRKSSIVELNKEGMTNVVSSYLEGIAFDGGEPLSDLALCRKYIFLLQEIEKGLIPYAITELSKYDRKESSINNVDLKVVEVGSRSDYSNSVSWVKQKTILDKESDKLKQIESFAKGLRERAQLLDEETGELVEYFPPIKTSSTTVRATIK
jgi:hypothetical protein